MANDVQSRFVAGLRTTAEDTLRQGGKLLAGALLSGSVVVLQYLVSRAAQSGGGPSHLGGMPFTVYVDVYGFGYVALVAVVALALVFADSVEDAIRFTVVPLAFGLLLSVAMLVLQARGWESTAGLVVVVAYWLFWGVVCWIAAPPLADRKVLGTLAPITTRRALWQRIAGDATAATSMTDLDRRRSVDRSAQRMVVLAALCVVQLALSVAYSRQATRNNPFRFDPRPSTRLLQSRMVLADSAAELRRAPLDECTRDTKEPLCLAAQRDSLVPRYLRRRDGLARLRMIDSLTNGMVLQRAYVTARYCSGSSSPAQPPSFDEAWYRAVADLAVPCDRQGPIVESETARVAFNAANGAAGTIGRILSAEIALYDELIRTEWARAIDDRHRWLVVMLGAVLVALVVCLAFGPKEQQTSPSHRFLARVRLNEREAIGGRFTPNERALGALVVVILSIVPLVRTVDPNSLSTVRPRTMFGGTTWSPVKVEDDSAKKEKEQGPDGGKTTPSDLPKPGTGPVPPDGFTKADLEGLRTALEGKLTDLTNAIRSTEMQTKERLDSLEGVEVSPKPPKGNTP